MTPEAHRALDAQAFAAARVALHSARTLPDIDDEALLGPARRRRRAWQLFTAALAVTALVAVVAAIGRDVLRGRATVGPTPVAASTAATAAGPVAQPGQAAVEGDERAPAGASGVSFEALVIEVSPATPAPLHAPR